MDIHVESSAATGIRAFTDTVTNIINGLSVEPWISLSNEHGYPYEYLSEIEDINADIYAKDRSTRDFIFAIDFGKRYGSSNIRNETWAKHKRSKEQPV